MRGMRLMVGCILGAVACGASPAPAVTTVTAVATPPPEPAPTSTAQTATITLRCIVRCDDAVPLPRATVQVAPTGTLTIAMEVPASEPWIQTYAHQPGAGGVVYFTAFTRLHPCRVTPEVPCDVTMHEAEPGYFDHIALTITDPPASAASLAIELRYGYCNKSNCLMPSRVIADVALDR